MVSAKLHSELEQGSVKHGDARVDGRFRGDRSEAR